MGSDIYVWPRDILEAIYNNVQSGNKPVRGFQVSHSTEVVEGHECEKVEIVFDTCSRMSRMGRINLQVAGISRIGVVEAEKEAVVGMIEALRTTHGIIHADFNHIVISKERDLYNALRALLSDFLKSYDRIEQIVRNCHSSLLIMLGDLSKLLGRFVTDGQHYEEMVCFSGFHSRLSEYSCGMDWAISRAQRKVQVAIDRDVEPEAQRRFDATVPTAMGIDWDASFAVLATVLEQAKKDLNLTVSGITVVQVADGEFEASLDVTVDPYRLHGPEIEEKEVEYYREPRRFSSAPYSSEVGAKGMVVFEALKYVSDKLHRSIIDVNFRLHCHHQEFKCNFDDKMKEITGCGYSLDRALHLCEDYYRWGVGPLKEKITITEQNAPMFEVISDFGDVLAEARSRFVEEWDFFLSYKDRSAALLGTKYKLF